MSRSSYPTVRLFVEHPLAPAAALTLEDAPAHYLSRVMRLGAGDAVLLFNGRDGEWRAEITATGKKQVDLVVGEQVRGQTPPPDIHLLFAPIKAGRIDWLVEKATELGAGALYPVRTARTVVDRINRDRLRAHAIEAAEQSERLDVPPLHPLQTLEQILAGWPPSRLLIFCDETGQGEPPDVLLSQLKTSSLALLIGPEGGFTLPELDRLRALPFTRAMTLGPRVLRADTAALAALTCLQLLTGDWHVRPRFEHG